MQLYTTMSNNCEVVNLFGTVSLKIFVIIIFFSVEIHCISNITIEPSAVGGSYPSVAVTSQWSLPVCGRHPSVTIVRRWPSPVGLRHPSVAVNSRWPSPVGGRHPSETDPCCSHCSSLSSARFQFNIFFLSSSCLFQFVCKVNGRWWMVGGRRLMAGETKS